MTILHGPNDRMVAFMQAAAPTLTTIDHMILSHPHRDHVELLPDLLATYTVRQVWDSGRINDICGYRAFLTAVRDEPACNTTTPFKTSKPAITPSPRKRTAATSGRPRGDGDAHALEPHQQ